MATISDLVTKHRPSLSPYESLYKHFHSNPELSHQERRTAAKIASELAKLNTYTIHTDIGGHGLAAVFANGPGTTVLLRADIDGLPVAEETGLEYASLVRMQDKSGVEHPVMHACGHDMHITSLLVAAELLVKAKDEWSGTLILCFQPAEERGNGARAMVADGLYEKVPVPDIVLGGHVMPFRAGTLGTRRGLVASSADSYHCTIYGRGGHGSQPHRTNDPILTAAHTIVRLQSIASREVDPTDSAVVTVGAVHAGTNENIIPSSAELKLDIRALNPTTRSRVYESMKRIIEAESLASNAPRKPELSQTRMFPLLVNDEDVTAKLEVSFKSHFKEGKDGYDANAPRLGGSEDFGELATAVNKPSCFWTYGGVDPEVWDKTEKEGRLMEDIPVNHSPFFAPVISPTLGLAADAYAVAALTWMIKD
ncbi:metal-dependent amidase/aminoacylase/carboxypeptidase [Microthyrium microscopicum]|uniref:Metal-dependent amidase/aminoacylase/carboxypeptidase n=1 Tax=Microthyrium microscopicum TaxID=703497 RepID=A0A6A6TWD9_9PEZI|nr:metal-dependent amidase/aminoacylase/carboxypeptidase [Microthyrium microscopicum]